MKKRYRLYGIEAVIIVCCCLLLINLLPVAQANTDYFSNSMVIIVGKSNTVNSPVLLWLFGLKFIVSRRVIVQANGEEGEMINALILPSKLGFYFGYEHIYIEMDKATGLFFWGEKSFLLQKASPRIVAICRARDIYVTYEAK
jgi:hypothetical protein